MNQKPPTLATIIAMVASPSAALLVRLYINFVRSGFIYNDKLSNNGQDGNSWTSYTANHSSAAFHIGFNVAIITSALYRYLGIPLRCLAS